MFSAVLALLSLQLAHGAEKVWSGTAWIDPKDKADFAVGSVKFDGNKPKAVWEGRAWVSQKEWKEQIAGRVYNAGNWVGERSSTLKADALKFSAAGTLSRWTGAKWQLDESWKGLQQIEGKSWSGTGWTDVAAADDKPKSKDKRARQGESLDDLSELGQAVGDQRRDGRGRDNGRGDEHRADNGNQNMPQGMGPGGNPSGNPGGNAAGNPDGGVIGGGVDTGGIGHGGASPGLPGGLASNAGGHDSTRPDNGLSTQTDPHPTIPTLPTAPNGDDTSRFREGQSAVMPTGQGIGNSVNQPVAVPSVTGIPKPGGVVNPTSVAGAPPIPTAVTPSFQVPQPIAITVPTVDTKVVKTPVVSTPIVPSLTNGLRK